MTKFRNSQKYMFLVLGLLISVQSFGGDILCANREARGFAVRALNKQLKPAQKPLTEAEVFLRPVIVDEKKQTAYILQTTVVDIYTAALESEAAQKANISEFTFHWNFFRDLPRGTVDNTNLTDLFCK